MIETRRLITRSPGFFSLNSQYLLSLMQVDVSIDECIGRNLEFIVWCIIQEEL